MRRTLLLPLSLSIAVLSCDSERLSLPDSFPPQTGEHLREWIQAFAPINIPTNALQIQAARVKRPSVTYSNLQSYFFAFSCAPSEAGEFFRSNSGEDGYARIDSKVTVQRDSAETEDRPHIQRQYFPEPPLFPDVFYDPQDIRNRTALAVRLNGAPAWFTPQLMKRGAAARCVWREGQVVEEAYYDEEHHRMFLRFDLLRPG